MRLSNKSTHTKKHICSLLFSLIILLHSNVFCLARNNNSQTLEELIYLDELEEHKRSEEINFDADSMYVGLGSHCQVAAQLNYYNLRTAAFPFDWLLSDSIDGIIKALNNNFNFFLEEKYLFHNPRATWWFENSYYKFEFRHEWIFNDTYLDHNRFKELIDATKIKYARRIERFRNLKNFKGKVFFIRTASGRDGDNYWHNNYDNFINQTQAEELARELANFFPKLNFVLIIINYQDGIEDHRAAHLQNNIFEFKVSSRNTFGYDSFKHVFEFIEKNLK